MNTSPRFKQKDKIRLSNITNLPYLHGAFLGWRFSMLKGLLNSTDNPLLKAKKLNNVVQTGVVKPFTPDLAIVEQTMLTRDDEEISIVAELKSPLSTPRKSNAELLKRTSASKGSNIARSIN